MKITIICDNTVWNKNLVSDWGFSCIVEAHGRTILFDTGAKSDILLGNMNNLGIEPFGITDVFISHDHWDHTGGLSDFIEKNPIQVYVPASCRLEGEVVVKVKEPLQISANIYSTGEIENIEHSLVIRKDNDVTVIAGCSHPGVGRVLKKASSFGNVKALIGGLHGFKNFKDIAGLETVCPVHCTQYIQEIKNLYPDKYIEGGAGRVLNF